MRHTFFAILCCLALGLCFPGVGQAAVSPEGDWLDESGAVLCLDGDGAFAILSPDAGTAGRFGLSWSREGNTLIFRSMLSPCDSVDQARMDIVELSADILAVRGEDGREWRWHKAPAGTVKRFETSLIYRERMALPSEVLISASLSLDSGEVIASVLHQRPGSIPLPVRIHYLASRAADAQRANFSAAIPTREGVLFSTPESVEVSLDAGQSPASVLLHRAGLQEGTPLCPPAESSGASLTETYWKLTTLEGQPVTVAEGLREPHMVLHEGGSANGSDGCNSFFMNWEAKDGTLSFQPGGGTLMMCDEASMEQARSFMNVLGAADALRIEGDKLFLHRGGEVTAVFQAVAM